MPEFVCPQCHAAIASDLIETTGSANCPFCGADLSALGLSEPQSTSFDSVPDFSQIEPEGESPGRQLPRLPDKSQIRVIEATDDRLVLYIPGGGPQANGLGCFALCWNLFMVCFTPPWISAMFRGGNGAPGGKGDPSPYILIPLLALFWAVGLGMGWFWLKMKFGRTFLLLERHRLVLQRVLFNRKSVDETTLLPESRAELVKSYEQNEQPVYRIEVNGQFGPAKFGTALSNPEKDWVVDRINEYLDVVAVPVASPASVDSGVPKAIAVVPDACRKCGAPLTGKMVNGALTCSHCGTVVRTEILVPTREITDRYDRLEPGDLPADSPIRIDEDSPGTLQFHYPMIGNGPVRWVILLFTIPFSLAWFSGLAGFVGLGWKGPAAPVNIVFLLFTIPFFMAGLVPLTLGLMAFRGRTTVTLTSDALTCRWHSGRLGRSKSVATNEIDSIRVESLASAARNPRVRGEQGSKQVAAQSKSCLVRAGSQQIMLTILREEPVARQVASLLRTRLEILGHRLRNA
jgi:uncharacterized Zn finger protein (UPF0148 family)